MNITFEILSLIASIDEFKGEWNFLGRLSPSKLEELAQNARIKNIGASMRLNGDQVSDPEVEAILMQASEIGTNLGSKLKLKSRNEQHVLGYDYLQNKIIKNFRITPISHSQIKEMHSNLLQYSLKDQWHRGEYKKLWHNTAAASLFDENETKKHEKFDLEKNTHESDGYAEDSTPPLEVLSKMDELINWIHEQLNEKKIHPLILIGMFIAIFISIRPFQNNNNRIIRALIPLFLLKSGYLYIIYHSLENIIEKNREEYTTVISQTQKSLNSNNPNFESWITFFLRIVNQHKEELRTNIQKEKDLTFHVPELTAQLMELINTKGRLTVKNAEKITLANRNTIKKHIAIMVEKGQLLQLGKGKGTWYIQK